LIYGQKAFDLRDKVSERQRYQIEGTYYMDISEKKAIEAFKKLLELHPEDGVGNNHLGLIYARLEEWEKAVPLYEIQRKLKAKKIVLYGNLASAYRAMGNLDKIKEVYEDYINNVSEHFSPHRGLAGNYIRQRQFDLAQKEINRALNLAPDYRYNPSLIGNLFLFKGDLASAEEEYSKLLNNRDARVQAGGRSYLRTVFLLKGQIKRAKEQVQQWNKLARETEEKEWELDNLLAMAYLDNLEGNCEEAQNKLGQALNLAVELDFTKDRIFIIHRQGVVYLRMNSLDDARATAGEIKTLVEESLYKRQIRYYDHLIGEIELKKGNFNEAIDRFEKALDLAPYDSQNKYALFRNSLAFAFYKKGDFDKAREEYERMTLSTYGRRSYGDLYAKSFFMLGKIFEQQGRTAKAIEHYQKFLDLWNDADPGLPEVEDTRKRLAGLKSQQTSK